MGKRESRFGEGVEPGQLLGAEIDIDGLAVLSAEFEKRLARLAAGQQKELKSLLERIV
ncbi:hypothetical protein [Mycobacterium palustre]|uniref:hypothetical protein n=1 Tax=Mycobacterium palustre TaxID=153971 RepID=UPI001302DD0C|nr:hypothetical protein [Mycobacterium palustre]MCV7101960.1 hypothetical protein [Mycobacterium palustre]